MKAIKRVLMMSAVLAALLLTVGCSGENKDTLFSQGVVEGDNANKASISCGMDVIAEQSTMSIAGIKGNAVGFSADRFACAMNLSEIECITITELPDPTCGSLYIGSEGVSVGQRISASDISLMTYEETGDVENGDSSFKFSVNDSAYEIACNVYMIDDINYSPTLGLASYASLNTETYKNISVSGVLSAYDPEGDSLVFEIVKYPENGRLELTDRVLGTYTYIPYTDFTGNDSFRYVVFDKYGNYSASQEISISVSSQGTNASYSDLIGHELHSHAIAMTECGLMNGVQVGDHFYFEAERKVSRAEFVVTAMAAVGIKNVPDVTKTVFADDGDIYPEMKGYIALAYSKGYISGIELEGKLCFNPNDEITMSEAAVIVSNMIGYAEPKVAPVFADADDIPAWSSKAIESLHTLGILEFPNMVSGACNALTRGDMAKLLNKTMFVISK